MFTAYGRPGVVPTNISRNTKDEFIDTEVSAFCCRIEYFRSDCLNA